MKEVTMITTCEITEVVKFDDEEIAILEANHNTNANLLADIIKSDLGVDDVVVLKTQIFIRD